MKKLSMIVSILLIASILGWFFLLKPTLYGCSTYSTAIALESMPGFLSATRASRELKIKSPTNNAIYHISKNAEYLIFSVIAPPHSQRLFWFVDKRFITECSSSKSYSWKMQPGKHNITVASTNGSLDSVDIEVKSEDYRRKL